MGAIGLLHLYVARSIGGDLAAKAQYLPDAALQFEEHGPVADARRRQQWGQILFVMAVLLPPCLLANLRDSCAVFAGEALSVVTVVYPVALANWRRAQRLRRRAGL